VRAQSRVTRSQEYLRAVATITEANRSLDDAGSYAARRNSLYTNKSGGCV
jgi:hypothetical protein